MNEVGPATGHNSFRVSVVTSPQQMIHVIAVRSICFMEETGLSAQQTYDGNDYQCTHVVMYCAEEPIGTLRIRWFKDFAKLERTALRKAYRTSPALKILGNYVFDHIARKGFDTVITHAEPHFALLWRRRFGFVTNPAKQPIVVPDKNMQFVELIKRLDVPADAIGSRTPAPILMRIEGQWDQPSEFERSLG